MEIGVLEAILRIRDEMSSTLAVARKNVNDFVNNNKESWSAIGQAIGGATALIGGAAAAIVALGMRGAEVADVAGHFNAMQAAAGNSTTVLNTLRAAFDGTVSDMTIMNSVNAAMSQGLKLTEDQFALTANTAQVLADRTGGDTAQAFETLNAAMATGRDATLRNIGLNIDAADAVSRHAASLGVEVSALTEAQVVEAKRNAILAEMKSILQETGDAQVDFADRVAQAKVAVQNFTDGLAVAISESPVLEAGMEALSNALGQAFGGDSQAAINMVMGLIEQFAIGLIRGAEIGVEAVRFLSNAWNGLNVLFNGVMAVLMQGLGNFLRGLLATVEAAEKIPGIGAKFQGIGDTLRNTVQLVDGMKESFVEQANEAIDKAAAQNAALDSTKEVLTGVRVAMEAAAAENENMADAADTATEATKNLDTGLKEIPPTAEEVKKRAEELKKEIEELAKGMQAFFDELAASRSAREDLENLLGPGPDDATIEMGRLADATERLGGVTELSNAQLVNLISSLQAQIALGGENAEGFQALADAMSEAGDRGDHVAEQVGFATQTAADGAEEAAEKNRDWAETFEAIAEGAGDIGDALQNMDRLFDALGMSADAGARKVVAGLMDIVDGAQQGAQAFASFASGDILGGISSGIGAIASFASGLKNLFGGGPSPAEILAHDLRVMQTEFINSMGGLRQLEEDAARAGVSLEDMWNARTVAEYEAAVLRIRTAIELTEEATRLTEEAMERFGLTLGDMGPEFAQGQLHEQFAEIYRDIQLLIAGGADMNAILAGGAEEISQLVQQAMEAGVALPEFMRPYIQALIDAGLLLDENGNKITDISQIPFTETLEAGVQRLIDKIEDLVNALLGIPPEVETLVKVNYQGGPPPPGVPDYPNPTEGASGYFNPRLMQDQLFLFHKGERVSATPAAQTAFGGSVDPSGGSGGDIVVHNHISLDGQPVLEFISRNKRAGVPGL